MENSSGRISKRRFREEKKGGLEKGKDTSGGVFGSEVWEKDEGWRSWRERMGDGSRRERSTVKERGGRGKGKITKGR